MSFVHLSRQIEPYYSFLFFYYSQALVGTPFIIYSLLKGEALSAINGLALTDANYETARSILQQRFGRKERIVFAHIQQLLNLSCPGHSTADLWSLYDKLQTHIRSLDALGVSGDTYGVILTPLVLHKLPENIRLEWAREGEGKESNLVGGSPFIPPLGNPQSRTVTNFPCGGA